MDKRIEQLRRQLKLVLLQLQAESADPEQDIASTLDEIEAELASDIEKELGRRKRLKLVPSLI